MPVKDNLIALKATIPREVTLVAVSKKKTSQLILEAYNTGHRDFGENYVQELAEKAAVLPGDIRWHFIGHLQTNKVKTIVPFVHLIQGVDSLKLLKEIGKQAARQKKIINVLLQLHISTETTKFGLSFDECRELLSTPDNEALQYVKIKGFMAMASNTTDEEQVRKEFLSVKKFRDSFSESWPDLEILSYGMSGDFRTALEAGSNMLRIGSLIFGERNSD